MGTSGEANSPAAGATLPHQRPPQPQLSVPGRVGAYTTVSASAKRTPECLLPQGVLLRVKSVMHVGPSVPGTEKALFQCGC